MNDETSALGFRREVPSRGGPGLNVGQAAVCLPSGPPHLLFSRYQRLYDLTRSVKGKISKIEGRVKEINLPPCKRNHLRWLHILQKDPI